MAHRFSLAEVSVQHEAARTRQETGEPARIIKVANYVATAYLSSVTFLNSNDLFGVYKGKHGHRVGPRLELYESSLLRMGPDRWDSIGGKLRIGFNIGAIYIALRYSAIVLLQIASSIIGKQIGDRSSGGPGAINKLDYISKLVGNPLSALTGLTVYCYSTVLLDVMYIFVFAPYHYERKPLDLPAARMYYKPEQEMKRIDLTIARRLKYIRAAIKVRVGKPLDLSVRCPFKGAQSRFIKLHRANPMIEEEFQILTGSRQDRSRALAEIQLRAIRSLELEVSSMRPAMYSWTRHREMRYEAAFVFSVAAFFGFIVFLTLSWTMFNAVLVSRCNPARLTGPISAGKCKILDVFTTADLIATGELVFGFLMAGFAIIGLFVVNICDSTAQLALVVGERLELENSLRELVEINRFQQVSTKMAELTLIQLEKTLLAMFVKLSLSHEDLRKNVVMISRRMEDYLIPASFTIIGAIFLKNYDGLGIGKTLYTLPPFIYMMTNIMLLYSAFLYAKTIRIERIAWSLIAQINIRLARESRDEDFVSSGLRKLVHSYSLSDKQNAFSPFGISMSYGKVLELNFFIITLVSLTRTF